MHFRRIYENLQVPASLTSARRNLSNETRVYFMETGNLPRLMERCQKGAGHIYLVFFDLRL